MSSPSPNLLTIPRELRDMIYTYLTQSAAYLWHWSHVPEFESECLTVDLVIEKAPLLNVLLIHPRIYHEYREAPWFKNLAAAILVKRLPNKSRWYAYVDANNTPQTRSALRQATNKKRNWIPAAIPEGLFTHLRHVTICNGNWTYIELLMEALSTKTPNISTVRIDYKEEDDSFATHQKSHNIETMLPAPPASLLGLPLVQRAQGSLLRICDNAPPNNTSPPLCMFYNVGQYTYGYPRRKSDYWDPPQLVNLPSLELKVPHSPRTVIVHREPLTHPTDSVNLWRNSRGDAVGDWGGAPCAEEFESDVDRVFFRCVAITLPRLGAAPWWYAFWRVATKKRKNILAGVVGLAVVWKVCV